MLISTCVIGISVKKLTRSNVDKHLQSRVMGKAVTKDMSNNAYKLEL